ncbi:MAG TPA: hydrogenase maturation protease [Candidatus Angelobacter sp.]|nr:hydrogenase maturation protease [Candidatus Angelobacter sp.]
MNEWEWQLLEDKNLLDHVTIAGVDVKAGDRVRLKPRKGGDIMDLALARQIAVIEALEQDYEGKQHVCVVLDDDPGRDLGLLRQPGHRFFFDPDEVEPIPQSDREAAQQAKPRPRILVAGIGNIFLGDDGFGVEVVKRLAERELSPEVRVADFGIRGFDLVYALQDGYETTILVDACPQGQLPGTIFVLEPDLSDGPSQQQSNVVDTHGMNPVNVIRMARAINAPLNRVLVVGCEPESLGGEEGRMGLSRPVESALDEAVRVIESLLGRILNNTWQNAEGQFGKQQKE